MPSAKRNAGPFNLLPPSLFSLLSSALSLLRKKIFHLKNTIIVILFHLLGCIKEEHLKLSQPCQLDHDHASDEISELMRRMPTRGGSPGGTDHALPLVA